MEGQRNENGKQLLTVAIGNFSYLATIGDFIKQRALDAGYECQFIERQAQDIQALLDQASQERLQTGDSIDGFEFNDDAILNALRDAGDDQSNQGFDFDFDDSEEQIIEEEALDLSSELLGTKIQQAAAKILINSTQAFL